MAFGWGRSKFTVQTVVVCVTYKGLRGVVEASLSHVAAEVKTEDWLTLTVECAPGRTSMLATTEISSAGFGSGSTYIVSE